MTSRSRWAIRLGLAIAGTSVTLIASPPSSWAKNQPTSARTHTERQVSYSIEGADDGRGTFKGTLTASFRKSRVRLSQTMVFADGSRETIDAQGRIRDGKVVGWVQCRDDEQGLVQGITGGQVRPKGLRLLRATFDDQSIETRVLGGSFFRVVTSAHGSLAAAPLEQGLSEAGAETWNHRTQGLTIVPASWFDSLEQAASQDLFKSPENMERIGFLMDPADPEGLAVGLAIQGRNVGLTCGACHTADLKVGDTIVRVQGGRANLDLGLFGAELGQALGATAKDSDKFQRFAQRVLLAEGQTPNAEGFQAVGAGLKTFLLGAKAKAELSAKLNSTVAGPGRTDAFANGYNRIFGRLNPKNLGPAIAPVRLPYLWGTAEFAWVQYNGSISLPLTRNLTASIAAGAKLDILDADGNLLPEALRYETSARIEDLSALEAAMEEIQPPRYPAYINPTAEKRGRKLYRENCAACHDDAIKHVAPYGKLDLPLYPLDVIGTDPNEALTFRRKVNLESIGLEGEVSAPEGLKEITDNIIRKQIAEMVYSPVEVTDLLVAQNDLGDRYDATLTGQRLLDRSQFRSPLAYRARSMDGIWAAAPYLHNGSVQTMYELLSPVPERATMFRLSTRPEVDTVKLGLVEPAEGWLYDTSKPGNANTGHEFRDAPKGTKGVIGRGLSHRERNDLIEYLKGQ